MGGLKKVGKKLGKKAKKLGRGVTNAASSGASTIASAVTSTTKTVVNPVVNAISDTTKNVAHETAKVGEKIAHEMENGGKQLEKTGKTIIQAPEKLVRKIARLVVEDKVNKAFKKKLQEALENLEKEIATNKVQEQTTIKAAINTKINEVTAAYLKETGKPALDEYEKQFIVAESLISAATHDCFGGHKDSVEEVLSLDSDDYALNGFLQKNPLQLALKYLATHQKEGALVTLLGYFDKNFEQLSIQNKYDYMLLKEHATKKLGNSVEKEEVDKYFAKLAKVISAAIKGNAITISEKGFESNLVSNVEVLDKLKSSANTLHSTTAGLLKALNQGDTSNSLSSKSEIALEASNNLSSKSEIPIETNNAKLPESIKIDFKSSKVYQMYKWTGDILTKPNCRETNTGHNWTPLHAAVHHGDDKLVEFLLGHGATIESDNKKRLPNEIPLWDDLKTNPNHVNNREKCIQLIQAFTNSNTPRC